MNLRHGLKIAKELVGVSITALAAAIADEVKEYDRRFQQGGYRALAKTPASARVLMGLAYAEFLAESTADEELRLAETKRAVLLKTLGVDSWELYQKVESFLRTQAG